jgi:D-aminopeptidase
MSTQHGRGETLGASVDGLLTATALGLPLGRLPAGAHNAITDVAGVRVGHCTVTARGRPEIQTGVTVVLPHGGNLFREKVVAATHVINGFGKSSGLVQVDELGQIESPIALTNTFSVPAVTDGLLDHLLAENAEIGRSTGSVNPIVGECNDGFLNDLRGRHVTREHCARALACARTGAVQQGAVGAGRGMSAFELKGGIGSSSRVVDDPEGPMAVGVLVLSNFGTLPELTIAGRRIGEDLARDPQFARPEGPGTSGSGSIMVVVATDAPVCSRQLGRILRRAQNGIARTGSATASGSGEVVIGFSTAARIAHAPTARSELRAVLREDGPLFDELFLAVTEATEEAVVNSLLNGVAVTGRDGHGRQAFPNDWLERSFPSHERRVQ